MVFHVDEKAAIVWGRQGMQRLQLKLIFLVVTVVGMGKEEHKTHFMINLEEVI